MSQNSASFAAATLVALAVGAGPAAAASFTAYDLLQSFNVITSGNLTTSSETEGAVLVGGNLGPGSGGLDNKTTGAVISPNLSSTFAPVSVYGNASGAWTVNAGDAVLIGGTSTASFANSGTINAGHGFSVSASTVQQVLTSFSATLAAQSGTAIAPGTGNALTFTGAGNGGTDYFTIGLSDLSRATSVGFNIGTGSNEDTIVINVTGSGDLTQAFNFIGSVDPTHVLWNFEAATSLELSGFDGSVVALDAAVSNSSAINGTVAAASFDGEGELHSHPFDGNEITPPPPTSVPEPGTLGVFAIALLGLAGSRASKRRQPSR